MRVNTMAHAYEEKMEEKVVGKFAQRFQLSQAVSSRAAEFYRLAEVKGVLGLRGVGSNGLALACLEISAAVSGESFDKTQAQRVSGLQARIYTSTVQNLRKILNISSVLSLRDMAVKFGCLEAEKLATDTLKNYKDKMETSCSEEQRECLDFSAPLYSSAALYTACKMMKFRCDRSQFQSVAGCSSRSVFQTILNQMKDCVPNTAELKGVKTSRKRKGRTRDEERDTETEINNEPSLNESSREERRTCSNSRFTRERLWNRVVSSPVSEDYIQWKQTILAAAARTI